ncbi:hypothetical protein PUR47_29325, partial [Klebsiella pneumoniae]|nr:hypothetical protein [Klebsiella pneumoniae]
MIRLYPEQLRAQLTEGLRAAYLLLGNDPLLLQESQDAIREAAAAQGFTEHHTFSIDNSTDWQAIFALSQAMSLFASRQNLLLILPENGPNAAINEQLATLVGLLAHLSGTGKGAAHARRHPELGHRAVNGLASFR